MRDRSAAWRLCVDGVPRGGCLPAARHGGQGVGGQQKTNEKMERETGFEPATSSLEG